MSIDVNMPLHKREGLVEDVVAGTYQVNIEHLMVTDNTVDSFIVVSGCLGGEGYDYAGLRLCIH